LSNRFCLQIGMRVRDCAWFDFMWSNRISNLLIWHPTFSCNE
jgi:hypothetical protein